MLVSLQGLNYLILTAANVAPLKLKKSNAFNKKRQKLE